jgi:hypothetical protein
MGADIYIQSLHEACLKKYEKKFHEAVAKRDKLTRGSGEAEEAQKEVEKYYDLMYTRGYFRDSYNATSLFGQLGLSWWNDLKLDEKGCLSVDKCKELLKTVKARKIPSVSEMETDLRKNGAAIDNDRNSQFEWHKMFVNKKRRFIRFLNTAIKRNEAIRCSV